MTTESKIFLSIAFVILGIVLFMNFEIAIDSHNIAIENQNKIDSISYKISILDAMQKPDTIKVKIIK